MTDYERNTSEILSGSQISELRAMFDSAINGDQSKHGLWTPVYDKLYGFITDYSNDSDVTNDRPKSDIDPQTWLWLKGARLINSGSGPIADLIRDYTIIQHKLRYGEPGTPTQMDQASNLIASRFLGQWLGYDLDDFNALPQGGTQPDIHQAAEYDAGPAAALIFNKEAEEGDPAGWAGTLLWGNLGDPEPWEDLVLRSLKNPQLPGQYGKLPLTQDIGSYNAITAAAAIEEFSVFSAFLEFIPYYDEVITSISKQFGYHETVDEEIEETNAAFTAFYGLDGAAGEPDPQIGSHTFGPISTITDIFKDFHYTVGTNKMTSLVIRRRGTAAYTLQTVQ